MKEMFKGILRGGSVKFPQCWVIILHGPCRAWKGMFFEVGSLIGYLPSSLLSSGEAHLAGKKGDLSKGEWEEDEEGDRGERGQEGGKASHPAPVSRSVLVKLMGETHTYMRKHTHTHTHTRTLKKIHPSKQKLAGAISELFAYTRPSFLPETKQKQWKVCENLLSSEFSVDSWVFFLFGCVFHLGMAVPPSRSCMLMSSEWTKVVRLIPLLHATASFKLLLIMMTLVSGSGISFETCSTVEKSDVRKTQERKAWEIPGQSRTGVVRNNYFQRLRISRIIPWKSSCLLKC